jgi:uncharacterized protein
VSRVLVTGASGLIGSAVLDTLLARGDEVVGLSRDPERARQGAPTVSWHAWDPIRERPPAEAMEGCDGVIHLVGETLDQRWTEEAKARILESREVSTRNLVAALGSIEPRPPVLVSQSAVGYYGDRGEAIVDEEQPPGSDFAAQVCVAWEAEARRAEEHGLRVVITRTGLILSREGGLLKRLLTPFKLGLGGPLAGGRQYMPWIQIEDEVGILLWALEEARASGPLNATSPNPVTNKEFSKTLGRVLGRPAVVPVPKLGIKALMGSELGETVTGGQRAIPRRTLDLGYEFRWPELEPALRDLT